MSFETLPCEDSKLDVYHVEPGGLFGGDRYLGALSEFSSLLGWTDFVTGSEFGRAIVIHDPTHTLSLRIKLEYLALLGKDRFGFAV